MFLTSFVTYSDIFNFLTGTIGKCIRSKLTVAAVILVSCVNFIVLWNYISSGHSQCPVCGFVTFSDFDLPPTALASFPGSGNTWLRSLIQDTSGILTGSEYFDIDLFNEGFLGEGIDTRTHGNGSRVLIVKTHDCNMATRNRYKRAVLLVRAPKDAILAEFHRVYGGGHRKVAFRSQFEKHWLEFADLNIKAWTTFYSNWLTFNGSLQLTLYNDLLSQPDVTLKRIVTFLQINVTESKIRCAQCKAVRYKRTKSENYPHIWRNPAFNTADKMYAEIVKYYMNISNG